jgi:3-isopropylmalate dehydrogenase
MMFRYTFGLPEVAARVEGAVRKALASGLRTADIAPAGVKPCGTAEMGDAVVKFLRK